MSSVNYLSLINFIKQTLRKGDRASARKVAQYVVAKYPEELEGLLILGGLSSPEESLKYISKAHKIAPNDPRVKQALTWAKTNLAKEALSFAEEQTKRIKTAPISQQPALEKRGLVWVWALMIILVLTFTFLAISIIPRHPEQVSSHFSILQSTKLIKLTLTATPGPIHQDNSLSEPDPDNQLTSPTPSPTVTPTHTPTPTATPTVVPNLYSCAMEIHLRADGGLWHDVYNGR